MKDVVLSTQPVVFEDYDVQCYEKIDYSQINSEMSEMERRFVNGIIRYYEPKNLLEIGVSLGGGTVNLLNAIMDIEGSKLVSIDRSDKWYGDGETDIASDVFTVYEDISTDKWELIKGKDPSEVMDELCGKFDFVVIDTAHVHPVESLNFLCVLPYLSDGAIVVLHDISLHFVHHRQNEIATRLLINSIASIKIYPSNNCIHFNPLNIAAFQVTSDVIKYIDNVFSSLLLRWDWYSEDLINIRSFLDRHYTLEQMLVFDNAVFLNSIYANCDTQPSALDFIKGIWKKIEALPVIFYGAGYNMNWLAENLQRRYSEPLNLCIWDRNAKSIKDLLGIKVTEPDFISPATKDSVVVITIGDPKIAEEVRGKLEALGYKVINGIENFARFFISLG